MIHVPVQNILAHHLQVEEQEHFKNDDNRYARREVKAKPDEKKRNTLDIKLAQSTQHIFYTEHAEYTAHILH